MTERLLISTADGKYTVVQEQSGGMRFLRHGEPWPAADEAFAHAGLVLALVYDLAAARELLVEIAGSGEVQAPGLSARLFAATKVSGPGVVRAEQVVRVESTREKAERMLRRYKDGEGSPGSDSLIIAHAHLNDQRRLAALQRVARRARSALVTVQNAVSRGKLHDALVALEPEDRVE